MIGQHMVPSDREPAGRRSDRVALLWRLHDKPTRARPVLTLAGIADAAVEIADAEGMAAISMQRVAARLGVTKMALYRYVTSKAELIAVMTETAVGEPPDFSGTPGGWRAKLERWAELLRGTWQAHPWLPGATIGDRVMGPREIGWTEAAVAALADTGLAGPERMDAVFLLSGHVRNNQSSAGTQPWTSQRRLSPLLDELSRDERNQFPALLAAAEAGKGAADDNGWSFGLQCILDGVELVITRRQDAAAAE